MLAEAKPRIDRDARREAILDVARDVFLEEGLAAASMSTIAARLGGSKGTLYNYFKSKEELFEAYVARHCAWQSDAMFSILADHDEVREALTAFGRRFLEIILSDFSLANYRLVVAEAQRSPDIGKVFYETGPLTGTRRLAEFLSRAASEGQLTIKDPARAANQFIGLLQSPMSKARQFNYIAEPTADAIEAEVAAAVDTFLAAFGPKG
jgi:AcrR family transcriptional regulator